MILKRILANWWAGGGWHWQLIAKAIICQCPDEDKRNSDDGYFDTSYTIMNSNSFMNDNLSGIGTNSPEMVNVG